MSTVRVLVGTRKGAFLPSADGARREWRLDGPHFARCGWTSGGAPPSAPCSTRWKRATRSRRPFLRFFACGQDLSHDPPDAPLPAEVAAGAEPFLVVGAMAGG